MAKDPEKTFQTMKLLVQWGGAFLIGAFTPMPFALVLTLLLGFLIYWKNLQFGSEKFIARFVAAWMIWFGVGFAQDWFGLFR